MKRRNVTLVLIALILQAGIPLFSQAQDPSAASPPEAPAPKPPKPQFFAGVVMESDAAHVKVTRTLIGRPTETRVFTLDGKTKTPKGGIKIKSRVTVRYQHMPEYDLALEIQDHAVTRSLKTSS